MKEKRVKRIVSVIPTIITLLCLLAAFSTNNWSLSSTLASESPQGMIEGLLPMDQSGGGDFLEFKDFRFSEDERELFASLIVNSPFNLTMTVEELSAELVMDGEVVEIRLPSEVKVPEGGSASLDLKGRVPPTISLEDIEGTSTSFRNMRMKLDIAGMKLEMMM
ncbi:MAG: hypothetical protein SVK08_06100 [Halobacteriota archaeon]|nr:hypothetical protein [Halobacteriota archaeon]